MSPRMSGYQSYIAGPGNLRRSRNAPPLVLRLPMVATLVVALVAGATVGHPLWLRLIVFAATYIVGLLTLRFAFGQPWQRLLRYRETP